MVKICLLGDICGGDLNYKIGWGVHSKYFNKNSKRKLNFNSHFKSYDIVLSNLESPVINTVENGKSFLGSLKFLNFLKHENLNYFTIANNHILDHGSAIYEATKACFADEEMIYVGDSVNGNSNVCLYQKDDIRIGICGFNSVNTEANNNNYASFDLTKVKDCIKLLKQEQEADIIIVSLHWGLEYINVPSNRQIKVAREIIDMGADIIHGHHPHVIMPFEKYNDGYIFYSLGNFLMDIDWWPPTKKGLIVDIEIEGNKIKDISLHFSKIKRDRLLVGKINNKSKLQLEENKFLDDSGYLKKQKGILKRQKIFSYLYLLINFYKLSSQTKSMLTSGFKDKLKLEKN